MLDHAMIVALGASVILLLVVLEMVRRRRLKEEYSLLWLLTAVALIVLSLSRSLLVALADLLGIAYPPSALFVIFIGFLMLILLHFSTVLTRLSEQNKRLAQEIALLRWEVTRLKAADHGEGATGGGA